MGDLDTRAGGLSSAILRNFSQLSAIFSPLLFARPPACVLPCVPRADLLLLEAAGGLVMAPNFFRSFPAIFPQFFAIRFDAP